MPPQNPELARWFAEEIQPHEPKLRAWLSARFPTLTDIDDLVQETYLRLWRARDTGKVIHGKAYLFAAARNAALDRYRRERVVSFKQIADLEDSNVLDAGRDAVAAADHDYELEILRAALHALPARCREVLVLRKHHGLSHREIAEKLGISPNTVNAQITLGIVKCRAYFRARGLVKEVEKAGRSHV